MTKLQANLVYNSKAGITGKITAEIILSELKNLGFIPIYIPTDTEEELDELVPQFKGIIIAAGGDGTFRAIAERVLKNKQHNPIVVLPVGTANNITKALNIYRTPLEMLRGIKNHREYHFDSAEIKSPWGKHYLIEGMGFGLFGDILHTYDPTKEKSVQRGLKSILEHLPDYQGRTTKVSINGKNISGNFALFQILNINAVGPRLKFAPEAKPNDKKLDVVYVYRKDYSEENSLKMLTKLLSEGIHDLQAIKHKQIKKAEIHWTGFPVHIDDRTFPKNGDTIPNENDTISVEILPGALTLWIPN